MTTLTDVCSPLCQCPPQLNLAEKRVVQHAHDAELLRVALTTAEQKLAGAEARAAAVEAEAENAARRAARDAFAQSERLEAAAKGQAELRGEVERLRVMLQERSAQVAALVETVEALQDSLAQSSVAAVQSKLGQRCVVLTAKLTTAAAVEASLERYERQKGDVQGRLCANSSSAVAHARRNLEVQERLSAVVVQRRKMEQQLHSAQRRYVAADASAQAARRHRDVAKQEASVLASALSTAEQNARALDLKVHHVSLLVVVRVGALHTRTLVGCVGCATVEGIQPSGGGGRAGA